MPRGRSGPASSPLTPHLQPLPPSTACRWLVQGCLSLLWAPCPAWGGSTAGGASRSRASCSCVSSWVIAGDSLRGIWVLHGEASMAASAKRSGAVRGRGLEHGGHEPGTRHGHVHVREEEMQPRSTPPRPGPAQAASPSPEIVSQAPEVRRLPWKTSPPLLSLRRGLLKNESRRVFAAAPKSRLPRTRGRVTCARGELAALAPCPRRLVTERGVTGLQPCGWGPGAAP